MAMDTKSRGGRTAAGRKSKGIWTAAAFGLVVLGLIGFYVVRSGLSGGPRRVSAEDFAAPDITDLPASGETGPDGMVVRARAANIQLEDEANPGRLKGELHVEELDPQANHRYLVKAPQAWLYLKNGWMLYVRSDTGSFYIPEDQEQPEKGMLQGNVRCEGYPPRADGTALLRGTLDRNIEKPAMVAVTESMAFDSLRGMLSSDGRVEVTSEEMDFAGSGLTVIVNQAKEELNLLDVAQGEYLKYRPKQRPERQAKGGPAKPTPGAGAPKPGKDGEKAGGSPATGPTPATATVAPVLSMYLAEFKQGVVVRSGDRTVHADRLDVWARLIDNALREGAIMDVPVADAGTRPARKRGGGVVRTVAMRQDAAAAGAEPVKAEPSPEVIMTWTGPLRVRPLEAEPAELKRDDVFLRFTAEQTGLVKLADVGKEMEGHCAGLDYGATSRRLVLSGPGPSSVVLGMKDFEAEAVRIEADLGLGIGRVPGPGIGRDKATGQRVSWAEQADFEFRVETDETGKQRLAGLKTASCRGKAAAAVRDSNVTADYLRAEFVPTEQEPSTLDQIFVEGNVTAVVEGGRSLTCDKGHMAFEPGNDPREPDPTSFSAEGHVVAKDGPSTARADSLYATLERGEDGGVDVTWVEMKGGAHFEQDDGVRPVVEADASELTADPVRQIVTLIAEEGGTARVERGGAALTGPSIELDGLANGAWVVGPGTFVNAPNKRTPDGPGVTASWTKEMRFDDTLGVLTAAGEVNADVAADALSLDKIRAERVRLELTPGRGPSEGDEAVAQAGDPDATGLDHSGGDRRLIRARAEGAVREIEGGANASVESWRYAADKAAPGGKRPERVMYLEGPLILASELDGTLNVDGQGRLLVVDRRYFEGAGEPAADDAGIGARLGEGSVGGSMFTWRGSMRLDRAAGSIHFLERVRLNHKSRRDASLMELECEDLTAKIKERASGDGADAQSVDGELESADARGAVWGRSASRELIADRLFYNAKTGQAEAQASEGNRVTVFDRLKATTITAAHIMWDLAGDRIEIVDPGTVTAPR